MATRVITDADGATWTVWAVDPRRPLLAKEGREHGWLTFMAGTVRRRFSPVPEGWEEWSDERLLLILREAT